MLESAPSHCPGRKPLEHLGTKSPGSPSQVRNHAIIFIQNYYLITTFLIIASLISALGGDETSQVVPAASTTFTIRNLRGSSAYKVRVSSMVGSKEGSPVLVTARTCEFCPAVRDSVYRSICNKIIAEMLVLNVSASLVSVDLPKVNGFAALNTTDSSTVLNWTHVAGVSGYLLTWRHLSGQRRITAHVLASETVHMRPCLCFGNFRQPIICLYFKQISSMTHITAFVY